MWISDSVIDLDWLEEKIPNLKGRIAQCSVKDISNAHRRGDVPKNGATILIEIAFKKDANQGNISTLKPLVLKQTPSSGLEISAKLGLAREAKFYHELAPELRSKEGCIPSIEYSFGDMKTGSKVILMEDLSRRFVDSGVLFGNGNPNNWSRDLDSIIREAYPSKAPSSFEVANETFLAIANIHAAFWKDEALLTERLSWLRGAQWMKEKGRESWEASQEIIQSMWQKYIDSIEKRNEYDSMKWDPLVRAIVEKAMNGISWDAQLKRLNRKSHFCLVHGDFWPGNIMLSTDRDYGISTNKSLNLRIIDWEMVGIGSGPQELGQYILSNMEPEERRENEQQLIRNYYNRLVELNVDDFCWEDCWNEYKIGGVERWVWFLVYFCTQDNPVMKKWAQFFHNQIKEFVHDHGIKPEDITQPRP